MVVEPKVVTVARAVLEGGKVHIESHLPRSIRLAAGQDLHLHLQYRFEEGGRQQEEFRIHLRSHLGDQKAPEAHHHLRDHLFINDSEWGYVRQVYESPPEGEHELFVDMEAIYDRHPWRKGGEEREERSELAASVSVTVD